MYEDLSNLIGNGFFTWRRNLGLCIPFLLGVILSIVVLIPFVAILLFYIFANEHNLSYMSSPEELISLIRTSLGSIAVGMLLLILIISLINSFFTSGAIAMAEQATREGKTGAGMMWAAGRKFLVKMFSLSILIGLIVPLAGLILLLPGIFSLQSSSLEELMNNPQAWSILAMGIFVLLIYLFVVALLLALAPYVLVLDSRGPVESIKASVSFFSHNKFDVFVIWILVVAISLGLQMVGGAFSVPAGENASFQPLSLLTGLVSLLVLSPLSTVWWARLYLSRTGRLESSEVRES